MKVIFCRLVWMDYYNGQDNYYDTGNMNWEDNEKGCGEYWNFMHGSDGFIRGFVMLQPRDKNGKYTGTININKLVLC